MAKRGRPSIFSQELADTICERLIEGESLRAICRDPEMPGIVTVMKWVLRHEDFGKQYAQAREMQADTLADEIVDLADGLHREATEDDAVAVKRDKLRTDARKWVASKLKPKAYGDRLTQEISGPDGGPLQTSRTFDLSKLTDDQLKAYHVLASSLDGDQEGD